MCICKKHRHSPVITQWIKEGYSACFVFVENLLVHLHAGGKSYAISLLHPVPCPCPDTGITVYVFQTPEGIYGHAIVPFPKNDSE